MHSSRMRTARLLPVSPSMHCSGGMYLVWGVPVPGGYLVWGGRGTWYWGVYLVLEGWCTWSWRVPGPGGYLPRYSPPVNRMTDRCKNITLPQTSFAGGKKFHKVALVCGRARGCQSDVSVAPFIFGI